MPQESVLGPLLFLVYVNYLSKNLSSTAKLFADNTSIFFSCSWYQSVIIATFSCNLIKISNWAYQWEMSFNPEVTKQVQEVIFLVKVRMSLIPQFILITPL